MVTFDPDDVFFLTFLLCFCPDEKDGLALSLKESSHLIEKAKERESQLQAKVMSLERQIQNLTEREQEVKIQHHESCISHRTETVSL